jgi:hypothetical protein
MKLLKLSGPRPVVLHDDAAFEDSCRNPGDAPVRADFDSDEAHAAALEKHAAAVRRFEGWQRYLDTYDTAHLPLRPGAKPVIFMVTALPTAAAARLRDCRGVGEMSLHAVTYGVVDILNLPVQDEHGTELGDLKVKRIDGELGKRLPEDALEVFRDPAVLAEVASHVLAAVHLPRGLRKSD